LLQAPQFARSLWVFTSQPSFASLLQLAKPVAQVVSWQRPLMQAALPLAKRHVKPQAPQLVSEVRASSQPLLALPSQSPKPALHWNAQRPAQKAVALAGRAQRLPQAAQLSGSLSRLRHAPVQSVSPAEQVATQAPLVHVWPAPQRTPQPPQLVLSVRRFTSQPSVGELLQSEKPGVHMVSAQPETTHAAAALAKLQRTPQPPQLVIESSWVSQPLLALPSQLPKPVLQVMPHAPLAQNAEPLAGVAQAMPQPPHAATSVWVLRQTPAQSCVPEVQLVAQVPAEQTWPAPHARPQAPQWLRSVWVSRHVPVQSVRPAPQLTTHAPLVHTWPAPQIVPHIPQWLRSVWVSRQVPEQLVVPEPQLTRQRPAEQSCPAGQAASQAPQWLLSVSVSRQTPPQLVVPVAQLTAHTPFVHTCPAAQARPHMPQFPRSVWRSRHTPRQSVVPEPQLT
jgi:hypothetical protein